MPASLSKSDERIPTALRRGRSSRDDPLRKRPLQRMRSRLFSFLPALRNGPAVRTGARRIGAFARVGIAITAGALAVLRAPGAVGVAVLKRRRDRLHLDVHGLLGAHCARERE